MLKPLLRIGRPDQQLSEQGPSIVDSPQSGATPMLHSNKHTAFSTFLPIIIKTLGTFTPAQVQLLTFPCYAIRAITYIILPHVSDHFQLRGLPTICAIAFAICGCIILLTPALSQESTSPAA